MVPFTMAPISHYVYGRTTPAPEVPREHKSEQKKQEPINTQKAKGTARERQKAMVRRARAKEAHPQSRKMSRWQYRRTIRRLASVVKGGKHSQTVSIADAEPVMNASYSAQHVGALCAANVHVSAGAGEGIAIIHVWSGIVGLFLGIRGWQSAANGHAGHLHSSGRGREV